MRIIEVDGELYVEGEGKMLPLQKDWFSILAATREVQLLKDVIQLLKDVVDDTESITPTDKVGE